MKPYYNEDLCSVCGLLAPDKPGSKYTVYAWRLPGFHQQFIRVCLPCKPTAAKLPNAREIGMSPTTDLLVAAFEYLDATAE